MTFDLLFPRTIRPWLLAAGFALSARAQAGTLPRPAGLAVSVTAGVQFSWQPVEGAAVYRVAVFDAADSDGKRPLLAAVWVKGARWTYGPAGVLPKAGKLPSTKPLPLPHGRGLRVMVAAARADGSDKSEWSGEDFKWRPAAGAGPAREALPTPTLTPSPVEPVLEGASKSAEAELELEGGDEFKSSPDPAVLDVEEPGAKPAAAAASPTAAAAGAESSTAAADATAGGEPTPTPVPASAADARALLKAGKAEAAEAAFRQLLSKDAANADLWEGLGDALLARRMKAEAQEAYSQALILDGKREHLREWIRKNMPRQ